MTITLELPPEVQARVQAEAAKQALPVEDYLLRLVTEAIPEPSEAEKRQQSLALLQAMREIGEEEEQRETFDYLKIAIEEDRLSERRRFA